MYKIIAINGAEYKLEYTIEASLYADCISSLTDMITDIGIAEAKSDIKKMLGITANIPQIALNIFYAGLMQAHGTHPDGDGRVPDKETAKKLLAAYIRDESEDSPNNFYDVVNLCIAQMDEDGFFNLIGLTQMADQIGNAQTETKPTKRKTPTDHQRKTSVK